MIIDCHHHLFPEKDYAEKLAAECDRLKIDKVCLMALPDFYKWSTTEQVYQAIKKYPDIFIGFASFDINRGSKISQLKEYKSKGFKGIKFILPKKDYDDESNYPVYEQMEKLGLVSLFHLGIIARHDDDGIDPRKYDIDNDRMRPIYLDKIARAFPKLIIIGAHLGNPWYEEAAMSCRWNPNLYFDLTGSTLKRMAPADIGHLLWWRSNSRYKDALGRDAWEKILFGSDVPYAEIEDVYNDYKKTMDALDVNKEIQKKVFGDTLANLLGLDK
ncbi:MAG: amidohydrolase family protein [Elusimicrobia bacterium]|nr:amidohydrolase family protein [Elusimicrobiota bacterium]